MRFFWLRWWAEAALTKDLSPTASSNFLRSPFYAWRFGRHFSCENPRQNNARLALRICGLAAFIPFVQLCPLPFTYWAGLLALLPKGPDQLGMAYSPHTLSVTPEATWAAAMSLIVPLAVFAGGVQLRVEERLRLSFLLAGLGALSLVLGFVQILQGPASALRFYEFTNPTEAVGFFANRNHFAAFLNVTLVLAALSLWVASEKAPRQRRFEGQAFLWLVVAAVFLVADAAGLAMARSRAGLFIAIVVLLGIVVSTSGQAIANKSARRSLLSGRISVAILLFAFLFAAVFGIGRVLSRFENGPLDDLRLSFSQTTLNTAFQTLPFGTGLGSFTSVYAAVEAKGTCCYRTR